MGAGRSGDCGRSRNRYWGTPLNIWQCDCGEMLSVGSREELEKVSYEMIPAPRVADDMTYIHGQDYRKIRLYKTAEVRLTLEDFFAKLAINFG